MDKGNWGFAERIWGLEPTYDAGRMIPIYQAIRELDIKSLVDVACGVGIIADGLKWVIPEVKVEQFDIVSYPEWSQLRVRPYLMDVTEFIKTDKAFDCVLFLNSYRNWDEEPREKFNSWLKRNARYFVTSNPSENGPSENWKVIGKDVKNHDLKLYEVQR